MIDHFIVHFNEVCLISVNIAFKRKKLASVYLIDNTSEICIILVGDPSFEILSANLDMDVLQIQGRPK